MKAASQDISNYCLPVKINGHAKDLTGKVFGRLTVEKLVGIRKGFKNYSWLCKCQCGVLRIVAGNKLPNGHTKSCGCLLSEMVRQRCTSHGDNKRSGTSTEYNSWQKIKYRCFNKDWPNYKHYGRRGITVCERWRTSFANFLADMGRKPTPKHSIDRINNNGHYEPGNCRWATKREQANNTRNNRIIEINGRKQTLAQWARELGISYSRALKTLH